MSNDLDIERVGRWLDDPVVRGALEGERERQMGVVAHHLLRCESPIELVFMLGFLRLQYCRWAEPFLGPDTPFAVLEDGRAGLCFCQREAAKGAYRLDFAVITPKQKLAIELDGHEFHERTKEQAARDKSRDRALVADGWKVLRFTGSEVWRDVGACISELQNLLWAEQEAAG